MPIRGLILHDPVGRLYAGFVERLAYRSMATILDRGWTEQAARADGGMSEQRMRRAVAYAWRHGFLT